MKRTCKNINQNTTVFNQISNNISKSNVVTPEMLNQLWMEEEDTTHTRGVRIIELNSSSESPNESPRIYSQAAHAWSYVNNHRFEDVEDYDYSINEEARRRRRMNMHQNENNYASAYQYYYDRDMQTNSNSFYETYDSGINNTHMDHQMNCFTIINNALVQSDSSTDDNCDAYEIRELNTAEEKKYWDHVYNEEVIAYDAKKQSEKRTVWIYSYKNQHLLADNDFDLVNIPSRSSTDASSTSTSFSISDEEQKADKTTTTCRIGSPIPTTFIPRLDLSLVKTLSTVTELSEPAKSRSKESTHEMVHLKPRNNWLSDKNNKVKQIDNSNVVNWMALSPRERRRRSLNTNSVTKQHFKETEVTYAEGDNQLNQVRIKSDKAESSAMHVQVDIHAKEKETSKEVFTNTSFKNESKPAVVKTIADVLPMKISFADADIHNDPDNNEVELDYRNKPYIKIHNKHSNTEITDPIEKLSCSNWISEKKDEEETAIYELENAAEVNIKGCSSENVELDSASRRLWIKNMQLMKSQQWTEYLPITCSPSSLHLSLSLSSVNCRKSWFRRLTKCLKCCK